jgi:predicted nucleic acid-binding protein
VKTKIVIDANILFASLIKSGVTAKLLFSEKYQLFAPEFLFQEFSKYKQLIMKKTHRTSGEFDQYYAIVKNRIKIVQLSHIKPFLKHASDYSPDPKDTVYLALAMKLNCSLWTNDKDLKEKQSEVEILTTYDMMNREND